MPRHHDKTANRRPDDENAIGLTRAFSPVGDDDYYDGAVPTDPFDDAAGGWNAAQDDETPARHAAAASDAAPEPPAAPEGIEALSEEEFERTLRKRGKHARHAAPEDEVLDAPTVFEEGGDTVPAYLHKSRRMRRILTVAIIILVVLLAAGAVFAWQLVQAAQTTATQQAQTATQDVTEVLGDGEAEDASTATAKTTTVPDLVSLLGMTQDEAVEALQHGAQVSSSSAVNEEGNPIRTEVRVALTAEPADERSGTPTVYLGLDEAGAVVQAGYSAATSSLGYGSLSFSDAVTNEHIIEKTLDETGAPVEEGTVVLPSDKMEYSSYATDGTTLTREYYSFQGSVDIAGASHGWSAALSYDYAMANATGNLADTIRTVYVYINA